MNWRILVGKHASMGVAYTAELVRVRLAYMKDKGSQCNQAKLLDEALDYVTLLRDWARANEPKIERKVEAYAWGKPGPMSDG